jgi:hypothetical protein
MNARTRVSLTAIVLLSLSVVIPGQFLQSHLSVNGQKNTAASGIESALRHGKVNLSILGNISASSLTLYPGFNGLNETAVLAGFPYSAGNPPDPQVAVGPSYIVETVNYIIAVYSKQGSLVQIKNMFSFFSDNDSAPEIAGDPKVLFDAPTSRWFVTMFDARAHCGSIFIAVSTSSDPTSTWNTYQLNARNIDTDQPVIGVSDDKFVVSANDYVNNQCGVAQPGPFLGAQWWVLSKNELVSGQATIDTATFGPYPSLESVHPVQSMSATTTEYMVSSGGGDITSSKTSILTLSITGTPPGIVTNQTATVSVSYINSTILAPQKGTNYDLATSDNRVQYAVWSQGKLWLTFEDSCIPRGDNQARACFRLVQLSTSPTITKVQDFDVGVSTEYLYYPALSMDSLGGLGVVFGFSSSSLYPSLAATGQSALDPLNSYKQPQTALSGNYSFPLGNPIRFGDYFGAAVDSSDTTKFWFAGEYVFDPTVCRPYTIPPCSSQISWNTFIDSARLVNPDFTISATPSSLGTISAGSKHHVTISINSTAGFAGTVSLTESDNGGITAKFNPTSVTISSGGSSTSILTITFGDCGQVGRSPLTVTATSGSLVHTVTVSYGPRMIC